MAKKAAVVQADGKVKVRVLVAGSYEGVAASVNDVIELSPEGAQAHAEQSSVDADDAAVAYAESLKAPQA